MNSDRVAELFAAALALPATDRSAYVDAATTEVPGVRDRVLHLLAAHERAGGFLASPVDTERALALVEADTLDQTVPERGRIGP